MTIHNKLTQISLIICLLCFNISCFGQRMRADTSKMRAQYKPFKNEIALDASYIFRNLSSGFAPQQNQIAITYKRHFGNFAIRGLFTPSIYMNSNKSNPNDTIPNNWTKTRNASFDFDIRVGLQVQKRLNRYFTFYYGLDAIMNYGHYYSIYENSLKTGIGSNNTSLQRTDGNQLSKGFGVSPFLGIQMFLTRRFAISLENNFTAMHTSYDISNGNTSKTIDGNGNVIPGSELKSHSNSSNTLNTFMNSSNKVYTLNMSVFF